MSAQLHQRLAELIEGGSPCATAVITRATGSVPNDVGAMMLVDAQGERVIGTVGGGALEERVLEESKAAIAAGEHRALSLDLTERGDVGMICGGSADVYIHVYARRQPLVLFGAGHVNVEVARLAKVYGYAITVVDERPEWCNEELYPGARLLRLGLDQAGEQIGFCDETCVVIATPGHNDDERALRLVAREPGDYIGLVASRRKALAMVRRLRDEGFEPAALMARLRSPVGLALGGRTPADLALSIVAELQARRHGLDGQPMSISAADL